MLEIIQNLELEQKVEIYRKVISEVLVIDVSSKDNFIINGYNINYKELIELARSCIDVYGGYLEKKAFYERFGKRENDCEEINDMKLERQQYIYNFIINNSPSKEEVKDFANMMAIAYEDVSKIAKEYAVSYLKYSPMEYKWQRSKAGLSKNNELKAKMSSEMLFEILLTENNKDDVNYIIDYSGIEINNDTFKKIERYINEHHKTKSLEEKQAIYQNIGKKIYRYKKKIDDDKVNVIKKDKDIKNKEKILEAKEVVEAYLSSDISYKTLNSYCDAIGMRKEYFYRYTLVVKEYLPELYKKYEDKVLKNKNNGGDKQLRETKLITDLILFGVNTSNGSRSFDLIDYYSLTDMSYMEFLRTAQKILSKDDYLKVRIFMGKHKDLHNYLKQVSKSINMDVEFSCKKDEFGLPIKGTGRMLTLNEKEKIIEIYKKYNIPFCLLKLAFERVKNNIPVDDLVIEVNENKVLKKGC